MAPVATAVRTPGRRPGAVRSRVRRRLWRSSAERGRGAVRGRGRRRLPRRAAGTPAQTPGRSADRLPARGRRVGVDWVGVEGGPATGGSPAGPGSVREWRLRVRAALQLRCPACSGVRDAVACTQPCCRLVRRHRRGHEPALDGVAAQVAQPLPCLVVLDALGHDQQPQRVGEIDRTADDLGVLGVDREPGDEGAVDLQLADRQPPQVHERRVAGAEVVQRHLHAVPGEGGERVGRTLRVLQEDVLGDLQLQAACRDSVPGEPSGDGAGEAGCVHVTGRYVHRDRHVSPSERHRATWASAVSSTYSVSRGISPDVSAIGDEFVGRHAPALGMHPAHQRLQTGDDAVEADLRLVVQLDLAGVERPPQIAPTGPAGQGCCRRAWLRRPRRPYGRAWPRTSPRPHGAAAPRPRGRARGRPRPPRSPPAPGSARRGRAGSPARRPGVRATRIALVAESAKGSSTANSSPPSRAASAPRGNAARSRSAIFNSSLSPARWPRVSLTERKRSRSMRTSAERASVRSASSSADQVRSSSHWRLGRPGERVAQRLLRTDARDPQRGVQRDERHREQRKQHGPVRGDHGYQR